MLIVNRLIVLPTAYEETTITMINSYIHTSTTSSYIVLASIVIVNSNSSHQHALHKENDCSQQYSSQPMHEDFLGDYFSSPERAIIRRQQLTMIK